MEGKKTYFIFKLKNLFIKIEKRLIHEVYANQKILIGNGKFAPPSTISNTFLDSIYHFPQGTWSKLLSQLSICRLVL